MLESLSGWVLDVAMETKFKGYTAKLDGAKTVRVINENTAATIKATGEIIHALKVQVEFISGYRGWSGGANPVKSYGESFWVRASRVS
jgi:hypothetical protein